MFFFYCYRDHRDLHSFPTRRSSDLYRYSLAIENFSGPYYWTEKVIDCYLSWTMPLYFGCTNLADYFPAESFVQIDIHRSEEHTSELQSRLHLVCRLLLEKKKKTLKY